MNLADTLRLYATGQHHQFCSTQFDLPADVKMSVRALSQQIPDEALDGPGREAVPHITVKYGLQGRKAGIVRTLTSLLSNERPIAVTLGKTSCFSATPSSDNADVVILELSSPDLARLNRLITRNVDGVTTFAQYKPHITVAYVRKGLGKKYIGNTALYGTKVVFSALTFTDQDEQGVRIPLGRGGLNAGWQIQRINNEPGFQGADLYRVIDENGQQVGKASRDEAGALLQRDELMREESGLGKRPSSVKKAEDLLYGRDIPQDDRLRRTTGGTGGTGGPGNG